VYQCRIREWPRSIVDQNPFRAMDRQRLQPEPHRILARRTACHRRHDDKTGNGMIEQLLVLRSNGRQHSGDPRMLGECDDRMAQHAGTAECQVLLRYGAAEPIAATGRDNKGVYGSHALTYRTIGGIRPRFLTNAEATRG